MSNNKVIKYFFKKKAGMSYEFITGQKYFRISNITTKDKEKEFNFLKHHNSKCMCTYKQNFKKYKGKTERRKQQICYYSWILQYVSFIYQ